MNLKAKLTLIAAIPIAVILFLGIDGAWQKRKDYLQQEQAQKLVHIVTAAGEVVHELQKERGMSAGFISSKGSSFADQLPTQHKAADENISRLKYAVGQIDRSAIDPQYVRHLDTLNAPFSMLEKQRSQILKLEIASPESFQFYTLIIDQLLEVAVRTGNQMPSSKLSRLSNTKQALLNLKERSGQERAVLTGGFGAGQLNTAQFNSFLGLLSDKVAFQKMLISYATPEQEKRFVDKISDPVAKEIDAIEQMVVEKGANTLLEYSPSEWFAKSTAKIDLLRSVEESFSLDIGNEISANMEGSRNAFIFYCAILVASLILTFVVCAKTIQNLMRTIGGEPEYAAEIAQKIAHGDLSSNVSLNRANDKTSLLAAMKEMQDGLRGMVSQIVDATGRLASSSQQLSAASQQVLVATNRQSDAASSAAASIEEMTVSISHVSDNAVEVYNSAAESKGMAKNGARFAQDTIDEMGRIVENVNQSSVFIQTLEEQSHKISDIVQVIKDIADQTNLLALNAAIEAARAGEQGRGFAVVADEVRKLAERTKLSTQDIATMIETIRSGTSDAVESMSCGTVMVNGGMSLVRNTGDSMTHIHAGTNQVLSAIDSISMSLKEQSVASSEIAQSVEGIAQMTDENRSAINEVALSAEQLQSLAYSLKETAARFRL